MIDVAGTCTVSSRSADGQVTVGQGIYSLPVFRCVSRNDASQRSAGILRKNVWPKINVITFLSMFEANITALESRKHVQCEYSIQIRNRELTKV
jgi:hypothetical protein